MLCTLLPERFMARVRVEPNSGCWLWDNVREDGYGQYWPTKSKRVYAHVFAYESEHGPVPEGLELHHECETPECVNPAHLRPLTHREHAAAHKGAKRSGRGPARPPDPKGPRTRVRCSDPVCGWQGQRRLPAECPCCACPVGPLAVRRKPGPPKRSTKVRTYVRIGRDAAAKLATRGSLASVIARLAEAEAARM